MGVFASLLFLTAFFQDQASTQTSPSLQPRPNVAGSATMPMALASKIVHIPHIDRAPKIEEFLSMLEPQRPDLLKISGFVQRNPKDGDEPTQRTDVYMGYDSQNLYVVWLCFDKEPGKIRAHMSRRENIYDDDFVELMLDTFHDQRHALVFDTNPFGIQADGLYTENGSGTDNSWDTVWNTAGRITHEGYVVIQSIPFRSLRFRGGATVPDWGLVLLRVIPRSDESDFFPRISSKLNGELSQEATVTGFEGISPGRNMQFNPYVFGRGFRSINQDVPTNPVLDSKTLDSKGGLDAKFVFKDSLVLDATIEPDFSQIESDQPQNTVNQRFEVFFPEKRPFFLENSNFFETLQPFQSNSLLFTRRIADPQFGTRLTGKEGPWTMGFLVADDRSAGERVLPGDPFFGQRAYFAVGRVAYDVGKNSTVGLIYTDREFSTDFNHVGGLDFNFKLNKNWNMFYRGVVSSTYDHTQTAPYFFGSDHDGGFSGQGERFQGFFEYQDISPGFFTALGFTRRTDIRRINGYYHFFWRRKTGLILHGPELNVDRTYDHSGLGVEYNVNGDWAFGLHRNTIIAPVVGVESDTLRPQDFSGLQTNAKFTQDFAGLVFRSSPWRQLTFNINAFRQGAVNIVVPSGQLPTEGDDTFINSGMSIKPFGNLQIDNTYILDRLKHNPVDHAVYNNHIIRSKWNYQFTPALSLRFIAQYNGLLANQQFSNLQTTKNLNFDFLITYLVHPGTAIYAGYNSNLENIDPGLCVRINGTCDPNGIGLVHGPGPFLNDGRQVFVKISYLWHP
jgi:hypothetical protein